MQAEFCLAHRKTSRCRTQRNHYYEVFRDTGKDMHGRRTAWVRTGGGVRATEEQGGGWGLGEAGTGRRFLA